MLKVYSHENPLNMMKILLFHLSSFHSQDIYTLSSRHFGHAA